MSDSILNSSVIEIPTTKGYTTRVNLIDADLLDYSWYARINPAGNVYAQSRMGSKTQKQLHRVILSRMLNRALLTDEYVDHIDGNSLNNLRSNLRLATRSQNAQNTRLRADNKTGYKGVVYRSDAKKWMAHIRLNGKRKYLGYFNTAASAHEAYLVAAKELFGEFARGQ